MILCSYGLKGLGLRGLGVTSSRAVAQIVFKIEALGLRRLFL